MVSKFRALPRFMFAPVANDTRTWIEFKLTEQPVMWLMDVARPSCRRRARAEAGGERIRGRVAAMKTTSWSLLLA